MACWLPVSKHFCPSHSAHSPVVLSRSLPHCLPRLSVCPSVCVSFCPPVYPYTSARRTFSFTAWRRVAFWSDSFPSSFVSLSLSFPMSIIRSKRCQTRAPRSNLCESCGTTRPTAGGRTGRTVMQCWPRPRRPPAPEVYAIMMDCLQQCKGPDDGQGAPPYPFQFLWILNKFLAKWFDYRVKGERRIESHSWWISDWGTRNIEQWISSRERKI